MDTKRKFKIVIEEVLYSAEEKAKAGSAFIHGQEDRDNAKDINKQADTAFPVKRVYGYPPPIETSAEVTVKIYEQVVTDLNIQAVITAVNTPPKD